MIIKTAAGSSLLPAASVVKAYFDRVFGNEYAPDEDDANPFRYCGEYLDAETGSYYLRARYSQRKIIFNDEERDHMIAGRNALEMIIVFLVNILLGRRLSSSPAYPTLHTVNLPKWLGRILFIVNLKVERINVCGLIWQIAFYVTLMCYTIGYFLVGTYITKEEYSYFTAVVVL